MSECRTRRPVPIFSISLNGQQAYNINEQCSI
jgi:hypothetical protein